MAASYEERILAERKRIHTTVFDVAFSPCGNFFASANNFGDISLFSLSAALVPDAPPESRKPLLTFKGHKGPIYSLLSTKTFLISGGSTEISGWRWTDLMEQLQTVPAWTLNPPSSNPMDIGETNALAFSEQDNVLLTGCGDNNIYSWDLEAGTCKSTMSGHTDYVQCLALRQQHNQCMSGAEDGTVRFWDLRTAGMVNKISPSQEKNLQRPRFGPWIGCVAVDDSEEWMVCGGGPSLSVWHLRSLSCTSVLDTPASCQQSALFHDDKILSAGSEPTVFQWQVNGELKSQVPCTSASVFALRVNKTSPDKQILLVAGDSVHIDAYINLGYKAFSFSLS
ncbi:THO complex subunit 6 homolog isoform X2 [Nematostella vectensis]|uniref:THO complex subunit 6 homolog isoform X2 n=1 Tax=Nematostella vectensis TaxID=45351 RepID=UPI00138FD0CA|nr:THO complex subunit 6 homolog isoform X2 [Nematostella vectensis]